MRRRALLCVVLLALTGASDLAAETDAPVSQGFAFDLFKAAELPGHRALMAVMGDPETRLAPFTTDGCSGGMSAGWALIAEQFPEFAATQEDDLPWHACCVAHDRRYHAAGSAADIEASFAARLEADEALRACVVETGAQWQTRTMERLGLSAAQTELGYRLLADSMYRAVRLGGGPCSGLPWRWGYGYPSCWPSLE